MAARKNAFTEAVVIDTNPLPDSVPKVREIGATSAPLMSASFFIGDRCTAYNDDYMQCKNETPGRGEFDCMKEGRRVTRCASSVIDDLNKQCLDEFTRHWKCLDNHNQQMWQCRPFEWKLNRCAFEKLKLKKVVPDQPTNITPVELRPQQIMADRKIRAVEGKPFVPGQSDEAKQ